MATKTFKVALSLDNPRIVQTGINVQSFDKESIKISISLTKDSQTYQIPTGAQIKISLLKLARQEQKIILDVPFTSPEAIEWLVPDYLDGYQGEVRVGVYLIVGTENIDLGYFNITSSVSDIDNAAEEFTESVMQGWAIEDLLALQPQFQAVIDETTGKDVISMPEIIVARGGAQTLGDRLDSEKAEVSAQLAHKATKTEVDLKISQMQSGVKGTYASLTALQTALPNGDTGNYVISENGHIYNWNNGAWVDTGIQYQSTGIAKNSITQEHVSFVERGKNLWDGKFVYNRRLAGAAPHTIENSTGAIAVVFKGEVGKMYTISRSGDSDYFGVATFTQYPDVGVASKRGIRGNGGGLVEPPVTFTLEEGEQYVFIGVSSPSLNTEPSEFQIEEGSSATEYSSPDNVKLSLEKGSIPYNALNQSNIAVTPEQTTFAKAGKNLWNGEFIRDYRLSGSSPYFMGASDGAASVIFEGETAKTYTISKADSSYFGVAIFDIYPISGVNGVRGIRGNNSTATEPVTVTLEGSEKYIVISVAQDDTGMPDWLQIEEGESATKYVSPTAVRMDLDLSMLEIGEASTPKLHVNKTNDRITIYVPSKHNPNRFIGHVYRRFTDSVTDTWLYDSAGIYERNAGSFVQTYAFSPGNSDNEGVLYVSGESDFIGGKHGFDYMEDISLIIDGKERDISEDFDQECGFVKIVNKSRVNHDLAEDTPENKAFTRYKVHTWTLDGMTLEGKWIAEHEMTLSSVKLCDFSVDQQVEGVTFPSWGRNDVDYIKHSLVGDFPSTPRVKNVKTQEMWSDEIEFYLALTCEYDRSKYPNHYTHIQHLGGTRAKIYFDFGAYTVQAGESIEYFNKYDFRF